MHVSAALESLNINLGVEWVSVTKIYLLDLNSLMNFSAALESLKIRAIE